MITAAVLVLTAAVVRWEWRHGSGAALRQAIANPRSMLDELEPRPRRRR